MLEEVLEGVVLILPSTAVLVESRVTMDIIMEKRVKCKVREDQLEQILDPGEAEKENILIFVLLEQEVPE